MASYRVSFLPWPHLDAVRNTAARVTPANLVVRSKSPAQALQWLLASLCIGTKVLTVPPRLSLACLSLTRKLWCPSVGLCCSSNALHFLPPKACGRHALRPQSSFLLAGRLVLFILLGFSWNVTCSERPSWPPTIYNLRVHLSAPPLPVPHSMFLHHTLHYLLCLIFYSVFVSYFHP